MAGDDLNVEGEALSLVLLVGGSKLEVPGYLSAELSSSDELSPAFESLAGS